MNRASDSGGRFRRSRQRGAALLLTLALMGLLIAIFVVVLVNDLVRENSRRQQTIAALAKAKEALIGYAAGVDLSVACGSPPTVNNCVRPGDLPCPDLDDDGEAENTCGNSAGTTGQAARLGRLPWKTLNLPDLRDGDGERLWYAVSNNFKVNARTQCENPGDAGCLNSETPGTITLTDRNGVGVHDGQDPNPPSGLVAVVIAPGAALVRDGAGSTQDRSCSGGSCDTQGVCTSSPASLTAKCNPVNYLDLVSGGEDNANFTDGSSYDGFVNGPIFAAGSDRELVNDTVLAVKYEDVMPLLERRVAKEAMNCLTAFAADNGGRYPWASNVATSGTATNDADQTRYRFGRLPDTFNSTLVGLEANVLTINLANLVCGLLPLVCDKPEWPTTASCNITKGGWWRNWKDQVFYGVAEGYRPDVTILSLSLLPLGIDLDPHAATGTPCASPGNCMTVNPSPGADKRAVILLAGRPLAAAGQPVKAYVDPPGPATPSVRSRSNVSHYLESLNVVPAATPTSTTNFTFQQGPRSTTFNDTVLYQ